MFVVECSCLEMIFSTSSDPISDFIIQQKKVSLLVEGGEMGGPFSSSIEKAGELLSPRPSFFSKDL